MRITPRCIFQRSTSLFFMFYNCFFWTLDFGLSWLTSLLQFIQYHVAGFDKPTIPQSQPSHLRDNSTCNNARLEFSTIPVPSMDEWCLKNDLRCGGLNSGPIGPESLALTTRPRLLANLILLKAILT